MRLSLRVQLAVAIVLVTMAVVLLVLASSRHRLVEEFARFEGGHDTTFVAAAAARLEDWYPRRPGIKWLGADSVLATIRRPRRVELLLQSSTGLVVAATRPDLRRAKLTGGGAMEGAARSAVVLTMEDARGGGVLRLMFDDPPVRQLRGAGGRLTGLVYSFYMPGNSPGLPDARARGAADRVLLWPVVGGALASIALLFAATSRALAPLRALTLATQRLAAGDRSSRVPVSGASELAALSDAFNGMADSLERAEAVRRQMVSDVAHELRTPLTNLRCRIEAIQDGLAPADAAALHALHEETLLLSRLVEDLQLLSLADAGRLRLERRLEDLRDLAARAVAAVRPRAEACGVTLELSAEAPVPAIVDAARVGQVLRNLLANALAHTPAGGAVSVHAEAHGTEALLEVRDTGEGLTAEQLPHVFDRFWRADAARAREGLPALDAHGSGAGLGLAIVRQLVELHGGTVSVTSAPSEGACFRVHLPLACRFTPPS